MTVATVVCGVDSANEPLLDTASHLAGVQDARLVVVHAFDEPAAEADRVMTAIRRHFERRRDVETRLVEGDPASWLLDVAREEGAALLIVGSRGLGAVGSAFLGSVSRALTKRATCPVVAVPPLALRPVGRKPQGDVEPTVVVGVDGSEQAIAAVHVGRELALRLGYRIAIVHARRDAEALLTYVGRATTPSLRVQPDAADRLADAIVDEALAAATDAPADARVEAGEPAAVLRDVAKRENGRLIVIAARAAGALHAAEWVDVPVVVVPEAVDD